MVALKEFRDLVKQGYPQPKNLLGAETPGVYLAPQRVLIDSGYMAPVVYAFCRANRFPYLPAVGRGASQQRQQTYARPTSTGNVVRHIGENYHVNRLTNERYDLMEIDADAWKTWVHQRLSTPLEKPGALFLYKAPPQEHLSLAKHLTAEKKTEEFVAGRGVVTKWERLRRQNHWFDALYNACVAGHLGGVRLIQEVRISPPPIRYGVLSKGFTNPRF
jgi:hypothetical protein